MRIRRLRPTARIAASVLPAFSSRIPHPLRVFALSSKIEHTRVSKRLVGAGHPTASVAPFPFVRRLQVCFLIFFGLGLFLLVLCALPLLLPLYFLLFLLLLLT